jgi:ABC-type lipoprotein release transport system permease subunit
LTSARLLSSLLYGVEPNDPVLMFAAAAMLAAATTLAASLPAWRAAWLDPMRVLREE